MLRNTAIGNEKNGCKKAHRRGLHSRCMFSGSMFGIIGHDKMTENVSEKRCNTGYVLDESVGGIKR